MSETKDITYSKCECGHPSCDQYTMNNQGSVGFSLKDARLFSAAPDMAEALILWSAAEKEELPEARGAAREIARERRDAALSKMRGEIE